MIVGFLFVVVVVRVVRDRHCHCHHPIQGESDPVGRLLLSIIVSLSFSLSFLLLSVIITDPDPTTAAAVLVHRMTTRSTTYGSASGD